MSQRGLTHVRDLGNLNRESIQGNLTNSWQINGLSYTLPLGVTLPAHGRLLLINDAPNAFRTRWNVPAAVAIFQYPGSLQWNAPGRMVRVL